ncbi:Pr6Pr family membrane protein [Sphingobacterium chungjuense]|uniref:Pr6Pr family membrane protein n=1 Tax=Sphingobacterium chungjuense TaxID=2675553 RepID=UPI001407F21C|nr:Pr6Pr family membrane protein [Sphingobacterium chungjuense]
MIQNSNSSSVKWPNAVILLLMALLTIFAISPWSAWSFDKNSHAYGWNLFSYFTIQSNFLAVITYVLAALYIFKRQAATNWFRYLRGGAVLYMTITGLVAATLLQGAEVNATPEVFDWKNFVLHEFGPLFIVLWWLMWPSKSPTTSSQAFVWLIFPLLWTIYTFIRAQLTGWYPYPFLNPERVGGWMGVAIYVFAITIGFLIISQLIAWISRVRANNHTFY